MGHHRFNRTDVSFDSGGQQCAAWLYQPDSPAPRPCVVMAHGFGGIRAAGLDRFAERFAAAGMAVLVFDYRHFGTSSGEPRGLIDVRRQRRDWHAAVRYARSLASVDPGRIALWGSSFSGGHVLATAGADPQIAAAVIQNPFVDGPSTVAATLRSVSAGVAAALATSYLRDELRRLRRRPPYRVALVGPPGSVAVFTTPDAEPGYRELLPTGATGWEEAVPARVFRSVLLSRPVRAAPRVRCPILVLVGDDDLITPARPAVKAARRAPRGELVRYPIGHFGFFSGHWFERVTADQTAFLTHHLTRTATTSGQATSPHLTSAPEVEHPPIIDAPAPPPRWATNADKPQNR